MMQNVDIEVKPFESNYACLYAIINLLMRSSVNAFESISAGIWREVTCMRFL